MNQRRWLLFTVLTSVSLVFAACGANASPAPSSAASAPASAAAPSASAAASPVAGGVLTAHLYQDFTSFDPWSESGTGGDSLVMELQWDFLAAYDEKGQPQMRLADSITPSADAKTWTIKLKPGLKWSDGKPLTSKDVIFTWKLQTNPVEPNAALWTNVVGVPDWQKGSDHSKDIPGITAPDDSTVVFQLTQPNGAFMSTLLNFRNYILPADQLTAGASNILHMDLTSVRNLPFWQGPTVGVGPYLWDKNQTKQILSFKPNPHPRGGTPSFSPVILHPLS